MAKFINEALLVKAVETAILPLLKPGMVQSRNLSLPLCIAALDPRAQGNGSVLQWQDPAVLKGYCTSQFLERADLQELVCEALVVADRVGGGPIRALMAGAPYLGSAMLQVVGYEQCGSHNYGGLTVVTFGFIVPWGQWIAEVTNATTRALAQADPAT